MLLLIPVKHFFGISLLFVLTLGLLLSWERAPETYELSSKEQQSESPQPQAGNYFLDTGTAGCPTKIEWKLAAQDACQGFMLQTSPGSHFDRVISFCKLNRGSQIKVQKTDYGSESTHVRVHSEAQMIKKKSVHKMRNGQQEAMLTTEDTLIFDQPGRFLWEHNRHGTGFSCLYRQ